MPTYSGELEDGRKFSFESDETLNEDQVAEVVASQMATPKTSAGGAFARSTAMNILPALASIPGAAVGAAGGALTSPVTGPVGPIVGGAGGAMTAAAGASALQHKILETIAPEFTKRLAELEQADVQQHPYASFAGRMTSPAAAFRVAPIQAVKGLAAIPAALRSGASKEVTQLAKAGATQLGLAAGTSAVTPMLPESIGGAGRMPTLGEVAEGTAQMMVYGQPRWRITAPPLPMSESEVDQTPPKPKPIEKKKKGRTPSGKYAEEEARLNQMVVDLEEYERKVMTAETVEEMHSIPPPASAGKHQIDMILSHGFVELQRKKGGKSAIQERSPTPVPVEPAPGDSQTLGQGIPEPEKPPVPQAPEAPQAEGELLRLKPTYPLRTENGRLVDARGRPVDAEHRLIAETPEPAPAPATPEPVPVQPEPTPPKPAPKGRLNWEGYEKPLYMGAELSFLNPKPVKASSVTEINALTNAKGQKVYQIDYVDESGKKQTGYDSDFRWSRHPKFKAKAVGPTILTGEEMASGIENVPATENGGRIAIIKPDGTAIIGGRIHADNWNKAVEQGIAIDAELENSVAGFVKPDGTAWGVNGEALPKVTKAIIISSEKPKTPALKGQRPPAPTEPPPAAPGRVFQALKPEPGELPPTEPIEQMTIYRAGDADEVGVKKFSSWTQNEDTAKAYQDNPGFGGKTLRREIVPKGKILDADTTNRGGMSDLAEALGFDRTEGEKWFDNGWRYPWEENGKVKKALENSGYDWIRYPDDFPEGAKTLVALKDFPSRKPTPPAPTPERPAATGQEGKVQTPTKATKKAKKKVIQIANDEGRRSASEIKSELIQRIEEAIKTAPTEEEVRARSYTKVTGETIQEQAARDKITISIPDDGEFTVWNTKENLQSLLQRAKKIPINEKPPKRPKVKKGVEKYDPDETAEAALRIYGDPRKTITHLETQAKLEDLDSAERYNLERAIEIVREQLPENILAKKIKTTEQEISDLETKIKVAEEAMRVRQQSVGKRASHKDYTFAKKQQDVINEAKAKLPSLQSELRKSKKELERIQLPTKEPLGPTGGAGPGTPSATQGPDTGAQIEQLASAFKSSKAPLGERIKVLLQNSFDLGDRAARAKDTLARALSGLKITGDALIKTLTSFTEPDAYSKLLGKLSQALETRSWDAHLFRKHALKAVPQLRRRAAIAKWVDAGGNRSALQEGLANAPERYKQAYRDALNLSGDDLTHAQNIQNYFEARLNEAIAAGVLEHGLEDYIHRIYPRDTPFRQRMLAYVQSGILSRNPSLARKRFFKYDWQAEQAGLNPVQDFLPRILDYEVSLSRAIAARKFVSHLSQMKAADGRPIVGIKGAGTPMTDRETGERIGTLIKPMGDLRRNADPADRKNYRGDYVNREYNALSRWKWVAGDTEGKPIFLKGDVAIHPDYVGRIDALLQPSQIRHGRYGGVGQTLLNIGSGFKQTMLDLSGFHHVQIMLHAMEHRVMPWAIIKDIDFADPDTHGLMEGGITLGGEYHTQREGLMGSSLTRHIPVMGPTLESYHSYLFQDLIPRIKMTMALHALKRNRVRFAKELGSGKMSQDALFRRTAEQANAAFGGLNYILLERSKTAQDMSRLIALAPDFLEARGRFAGQALNWKYGQEQRVALVLGALTMWTLSRILNKAIDNQYHLEPENLFNVVYKGNSYGLRTVQGDILHLLTKPIQFWMSRLNPVYGRTAMEFATGRDWFGRKRSMPEQAWDAVSNIIPISLRSNRERTMWESMLNAFGVTARRYNDVDNAFKLAQKWKAAHGVQMRGEFIYDLDKDALRSLKIALVRQDEGGAVKEIQRLLQSKATTMPKLNQYFERYASMPFTGSRANDRKFIADLSEDERMTVESGRQTKQRILKLFRTARNQYWAAGNR